MRTRLLWVLAISALMCGSAFADPISPFNCGSGALAAYSLAAGTCGVATDWVSPVDVPNPWPAGVNVFSYTGGPTTTAGAYYAASVAFVKNGGTLEIYLANTSDLSVWDMSFIMMGLAWDVNGAQIVLTPQTATLIDWNALNGPSGVAGPSVVFGGVATPSNNLNVGGEWGFGYDNTPNIRPGSPIATGPNYGISSTGITYTDVLDKINFCAGDPPDNKDPDNHPPCPNLADQYPATDGPQYGMLSNSTVYNNNGGVQNAPMTQGVIKFTLSGLPEGFDIRSIDNVMIAYGTGWHEVTWPHCLTDSSNEFGTFEQHLADPDCGGTNEVPEPASLILLGSGFLGLAGFLRRKLT